MLAGGSYLPFRCPRGRRRRLGKRGVWLGRGLLAEEVDAYWAWPLLGDVWAADESCKEIHDFKL